MQLNSSEDEKRKQNGAFAPKSQNYFLSKTVTYFYILLQLLQVPFVPYKVPKDGIEFSYRQF